MIGERWNHQTPIVRVSLAAPLGLIPLAPLARQAIGHPFTLASATGCTLLVIAWMGFVAWRVAMNAYRDGRLFDEAC
jgi:hypothetical protein